MNLIEMSLSGAVIIAVIIIARSLWVYKLPKKTFLVLWLLVLCRLLIPVSMPFNLINLPTTQPAQTFEQVPFVPPVIILHEGGRDYIREIAPPTIEKTPVVAETPQNTTNPLIVVWLLGAILFTAFFTFMYKRHYEIFKASSIPENSEFIRNWLENHKLKRPIEIRRSNKITSPLTYGILRPVILLPIGCLDEAELTLILAHEFVHIKRFDTLSKLAAVAALCLHWFNPLVWLMFYFINRDIELSCDEAVIKMSENKKGYALTLINMTAASSSAMPVLYNNFSRYAIEERINAIMKMKKTSILAIAASVALVSGAIGLFGATGVLAQTSTPQPIEFTVEYLTDRHGNEFNAPASTSLAAADVIETGVQALEQAFGVNLEGRQIHMMYLPRTEAHYMEHTLWIPTEEDIAGMMLRFTENGMSEEEAEAAVYERITASREFMEQSPDPIFVEERPSNWFGRLFPENAQEVEGLNLRVSEFDFRVNAETGAVESLSFELAANEVMPSEEERIAFWEALHHDRQQRPEQPPAPTPAIEAEIRELARQAIEDLNLLDAEIAEYGQIFLSSHPNIALQSNEQASLTVTCVNGVSVELLFTTPLGGERILTWIQFR